MPKYNWAELEKEYMLGKDRNLKDFAERKHINYGYLRKHAIGWEQKRGTREEHKKNKVIEKVTEQEIQYEINRSLARLNAGDVIMAKLQMVIQGIKPGTKGAAYQLQVAAATLEKVQKVQTLDEGKNSLCNLENNLFDAIVGKAGEDIETDDIPELRQAAAAGDDMVEPSDV